MNKALVAYRCLLYDMTEVQVDYINIIMGE